MPLLALNLAYILPLLFRAGLAWHITGIHHLAISELFNFVIFPRL